MKALRIIWVLLFVAVAAYAASPESCVDKSVSSTDSTATFGFKGCPLVFNMSDKLAYASFYGDAATTSSTPVPARSSATQPGVVGVCVIPTSVVHVIMNGADTGTVRVCNYGGAQ